MNKKIHSTIELPKKINYIRKNKKIVLCHGVFDIIHSGHIEYFKKAKSLGDILIVSVTEDKFVHKGIGRPFYKINERLNVLSQISLIDYICISNELTSIKTIKLIKPEIYFKGKDYKNSKKDITGNILNEKKAVESYGGKLVISTTDLHSSSSYINKELNIFNDLQKSYIKKIKRSIDEKKIINYFNKIKNTEVLIIGESIIDKYIFSDVLGKAGKDPILTIAPFKEKNYLGGVLSMGNILSSFCKKITIVTYLGDKENNLSFIKDNLNKNVNLKFILKKDSPTIKKTRYLDKEGRSKIIGIYDINDNSIDQKEESKLKKLIESQLKINKNVIVADYGHGLLTENLIKLISKKAKNLSINTQLNSANFGYHTISKYKKSDVVCVHEGELRQDFRSPSVNINILAKQLSKKLKAKNIYITQGSNGALSLDKKEIISCPAFTNKVIDKVGAGDSFLSIVSICSFIKMPNILSLFIGNYFGSIAVTSLGNSVKYDREKIIKSILAILK